MLLIDAAAAARVDIEIDYTLRRRVARCFTLRYMSMMILLRY